MRKLILILFLAALVIKSPSQSLDNSKLDGYRPIWFELGQKYKDGDKYSGALGTYTAKHVPLAIYSEKADKTFFVFGGTKSEKERYLLCMIGEFDHKTGRSCQRRYVGRTSLFTTNRLLSGYPQLELSHNSSGADLHQISCK